MNALKDIVGFVSLCGCLSGCTFRDMKVIRINKNTTNAICEIQERPVRYLSNREFIGVLKKTVPAVIYNELAVKTLLNGLLNDRKKFIFDTETDMITAQIVDSYFGISLAVGMATVQSASNWQAFVNYNKINCSALQPSAICLDSFIQTFAKRVYGRPIHSEESDLFKLKFNELTSSDVSAAYAGLIVSMLTSKETIYDILSYEDPDSPFALARTLSFALTGTSADDALIAKAESGELASGTAVSNEIQRLMRSPEARNHFRNFVFQWLQLDAVPVPTSSSLPTVNKQKLRDDAVTEILDLMEYIVFDQKKGITEIFTSDLGKPHTPELAAVYGLSTPQPGIASLGADRPGILTRAALLLAAFEDPSAIHRGVNIQESVLCNQLPPPPAEAPKTVIPPVKQGVVTYRQALDGATSPSMCISCHSQINPPGLALQHFDGLARYRTTEMAMNYTTGLKETAPLDVRVNMMIEGEDMGRVDGEMDLTKMLSQHPVVSQCFMGQWLSFGNGQNLRKSCGATQLGYDLKNTGSVFAVVESYLSNVNSNPINAPVPLLGAQLFANCSSCHTPSQKSNRTAGEITFAIGTISAMSALKSLTSAQIQQIAEYLATQ